MTALWIICGVALFFVLLLMIPVGIELRYDGDISLCARIAFVRIALIPKRRKKIKLRKFSKKRFEKMIAKEKKKEKKKKEKKAAKKSKKPPDKAAPERSGSDAKKDENKEETPKLVSDLWDMRSLIAHTIGSFIHRVKTKEYKIRVIIGSDDAATSALIYGAAVQFAVYVTEALRSQTKMRCRESVKIGVDFTSEKTEAEIALRFAIPVGSALATAIGFGVGFFKHKIREDKR